jgi:ribosome-binding factor A
MQLRFAPSLSFRADASFAEAARIDRLIARERARLAGVQEDDDGAL